MKRRHFIGTACCASLASMVSGAQAADDQPPTAKQYHELRLYRMDSVEQQKRFLSFLKKAAIPAMNRADAEPVGVFLFQDPAVHDVYVLLSFDSLDGAATLRAKLLSDKKYIAAGGDLLQTDPKDPLFTRIESSLLLAFDACPKLETPVKSDGRIFQLRCYESHSVDKGQKKIHMFNEGGETALFRKTGMNPVFFGEALFGEKIPNLTYMIGFESAEEKEAAWKRFLGSDEWKKMKSDPQYADTVSNITNIMLNPAACSQI